MDGWAINFIEDVGWQGGGGEGICNRWQIASEVGDESFGTCKRTSANGSCVLLAFLQESGGLRVGYRPSTGRRPSICMLGMEIEEGCLEGCLSDCY